MVEKRPLRQLDPVEVRMLPVLLSITVGVVAALLWTYLPPVDLRGFEGLDGIRIQLTFLAFLIAFSSYLATVTRDIRKLPDEKWKKRRATLQRDIAYIRSAEQSVVVLGLLTIARILAPAVPTTNYHLAKLTPKEVDVGLLIYFGVIVLYAAGLHARDWWFRDDE